MQVNLRKVIWAEGVLLGQQHFQQWDNYYQTREQIYNQSIAPFAWGLIDLQIDEEALLNSQFRIKHCTAIYPNRTLINFNASEDSILSCKLTNHEKTAIYLCVPINQNVSGITGYQHSEQIPTWHADYQIITDIYDNDREREILFGKLNLQLLQEHESREQFHYLKIAEVLNNGDNGHQLIASFIPPIVQIKTSSALLNMITRLLEIISAKIRVLKENHEQNQIRQILNSSFINLQHMAKHPAAHPERLFIILSKLTAELGIFVDDFSLSDLPNYQHEQLTKVFNQLHNLLNNLLDAIMPNKMASIKLRRESDALYMVDSIDSSLLNQTDFFIAVYFPADNTTWIDQFARQAKIGSHQVIQSLITSALSGVKIVHIQRPPNKLSVKPGFEYFYLEQIGDFWEQIKQDKSLAIFVPNNFIKATIELVTVGKG
jgi:type VI secretion system protein ImpJ